MDNQVISAGRRNGKVTTLKPQILSFNLNSTIQSIGYDVISLGASAADFTTENRFPAGVLTVKVDGRNAGETDPTPIPVAIAVFDDISDGAKADTAAADADFVNLPAPDRVHAYDETKMAILRESDKFGISQLKNNEGKSDDSLSENI